MARHAAPAGGRALADVLPAGVNWRTPHVMQLNLRMFILLIGGVCMGFDSAMMNGLQDLETWKDYFNNPRSWLLGVVNAVLNLAPIVGGLPAAYLSDRFGRLLTVRLGCIMLVFASALQAGSRNLGMFVASRFLIGIGIELCVLSGPVLITELAYPKYRSQMTSLFLSFFYVGSIIASWTIFGTSHMTGTTWSWRIPSLLQAFVPLCQGILSFFVAESPRWLYSKGREDEARQIFVKYHAGGDENSALVDFEMEQIREYFESDVENSKLKWTALWKSVADRKRLLLVVYIAFMTQVCGSALISYYLTLILDTIGITGTTTQTLINAILSIVCCAVAVVGAVMVDRVGRRPMWLIAVVGMLVSFIIWTVLSALFAQHNSAPLGRGVLTLVFLFQSFYSFGVTPLSFSYAAEVLPFHARQKGMTTVYMCNSIALLYNNMVNPIAMDAISWKYYFVFIAMLIQWVIVIYFVFPETKGKGLEELQNLFEPGVIQNLTKADDLEAIDRVDTETQPKVPAAVVTEHKE
ncbi:hypothetical protein SEUCBS139899_009839 [Sporothrix eucalyptigena]|uniref:Major facilitator superfamily (MFS) profile domain-containing protein n=1 Tax=Sporothrix eucalyptigena TaxID=1812306 RepID=A0ABP0D0Z9_9PEZI